MIDDPFASDDDEPITEADDVAEGINPWTYDPITGEPIIHLGPNDDATQQQAVGDPWEDS